MVPGRVFLYAGEWLKKTISLQSGRFWGLLPDMEQRNFEPLLILGTAGIFLFLLTAFYLDSFPTGQGAKLSVISRPDTIQVQPVKTDDNPGNLHSLLRDRDTIGNLLTGMELFYQALQRVETDHTLLHIAYFGDSMIEGDLVTQSLRRAMQKRFGGNGIGFVPVTTPNPGFRMTVRQSFNESWNIFSFIHHGKPGEEPPGISGYVYISDKGAETKYESGAGYGRFHRAEILFGGKNVIDLEVTEDTATRYLSLIPDPASAVSCLTVFHDSAFSAFEMLVKSQKPGVIYGVNFENGPGVYVDNYAFRGNSGLPLNSVPAGVFSGFNRILKNKLLVLHYGLNVFTPGVEDYHWYEQAMTNVLQHVKESSPGISILMISMPDRSALISGEYQTPAGLPEFIRMQQRIAAAEHIAFFNLYQAMGGAGSMKRWVEGEPKLAGDDYTHPNGAGAAKIASMVHDFLMKGYERYHGHPDSTFSLNHPNLNHE